MEKNGSFNLILDFESGTKFVSEVTYTSGVYGRTKTLASYINLNTKIAQVPTKLRPKYLDGIKSGSNNKIYWKFVQRI